ncbi:MAG: hypothetical protein U5K79_18115 [Cyclobacteriaceae bacterium]|nr:hypothetical protein [Cyclobacteriaceae bacterium]
MNFDLSFTPTSIGGGGWNHLANPYPSELDWNSGGFGKTNIAGDAIYIWNPVIQNYGTYNGSIGTLGVTQYIASGQAFFVKAQDASGDLTASEQAKSSANGNSFMRLSNDLIAQVGLRITSDKNHIDETVVTFMPDATDQYDWELDALKFSAGWVNLASKLDNDKLMAINAMGAPRGVKNVNIDVNPYYYGKYTFTFPEVSNFEEQSILKLHDNFLNKSVSAIPGAKYDFTVIQNNPSTFHERFELQLVSPVKINMEDLEVRAGQEFVVPVTADQFADVLNSCRRP